jgi:uncharacterized protein YbcI
MADTTAVSHDGAAHNRSQLADISAAMVHIYKDVFGRGPTKTRTDFAGPDTVVCVLHDTLTTAERSMAEIGAHDRLREQRIFLQYSHEETFRGAVERILERQVVAFLSAMDPKTGTALEAFTLRPLEELDVGP